MTTSLTLRHGTLSFSAWAEGAGPTILCLHGFPDHARSFRAQLPAFARAGFRAIAVTMRGYGPSSQPVDGDYQLLRMAEDVAAWVDDSRGRVHLVGHDWGAIIGYCVAAMLLSPPALAHDAGDCVPGRFVPAIRRHPGQLLKSWYMSSSRSGACGGRGRAA